MLNHWKGKVTGIPYSTGLYTYMSYFTNLNRNDYEPYPTLVLAAPTLLTYDYD